MLLYIPYKYKFCHWFETMLSLYNRTIVQLYLPFPKNKRCSLGSGLSGTVICCLDNRVCLVGRARVRGCGGILFLWTTFRVSLRPFTPFSLVNRNGNIFGKLTFSFLERFVWRTGIFSFFFGLTLFAPCPYFSNILAVIKSFLMFWAAWS